MMCPSLTREDRGAKTMKECGVDRLHVASDVVTKERMS